MEEERPVAVSARFDHVGSGVGEQTVDLKLRFSRKRVAYVHLSWRAPVRKTVTLLRCSKGFVEIDADVIKLVSQSGQHMRFNVSDEADDSYHARWFAPVFANFLDALKGRTGASEIAQRTAELRNLMLTIVAARKSAELSGEDVAVKEIEETY